MADDGMLLNLAAPSPGYSSAKPAFKGGRWKDRLTARKSFEYGLQKRREREEMSTDRDVARPTEESAIKRRRVDEAFVPNQNGRPARGAFGGSAAKGHAGNREVISSLFTYNPSATTLKEDETESTEPVEATNAPLSAEAESFASLGLSRQLATHLPNKMSITAPTSIQQKAVTQLLADHSDAFIQAETGSGKTLSYLLPIVQRLMTLSESLSKTGQKLDRNSGLFAIILAPTRELSKQIVTVLETLLGCAHWIVAGNVIGGEKKKSEKARLRKGVNILVATPGRLADHLNNTEVLDVSKVRWLVLDEGDRLMELGFEQDIQKIVSTLNLRMRAASKDAVKELLPQKRTTVLCSATMKMDVQRLGEISLKDAVHIASDKKKEDPSADGETREQFQAPSQLKQSYAVVPAKQRLVALVALLKRSFARKGSTMKAIVFLSCADSVDFHFELLTRPPPLDVTKLSDADVKDTPIPAPKQRSDGKIAQGNLLSESVTSATSPDLSSPNNDTITLFRLHGSLPQALRTSTLQSFAKLTTPAILLATDVASRGLDLPNIDFVIEYDPPFSADEHLHRIGRTARAGREGRALIFLMPGCEEGYVDILRAGRRAGGASITRHDAEDVLKKGFAPTSGVVVRSRQWEDAATNWQLDVERWVLENNRVLEAARRAYQSHIRAYATHVAAERGMFDIKQLHLGHLAKAFGLRDRPGSIKVPGLRTGKDAVKKARASAGAAGAKRSRADDDESQRAGDEDVAEAKRKMRMKMQAMGGASEFNLG